MVEFPRVAVFDGASWTPSVRDLVTARGYRPASGLDADVVVLSHGADLPPAVVDAVRGGLGLVVLVTGATGRDTVAPGVAGLLGRVGIRLESPATDGSACRACPPGPARPRRQPPPSPTWICWPGSTPPR